MVTLADVIRRRREALGLNQPQLAAKAGVRQSTIGNLESGTRGASGRVPSSLPDIARALGTTTEELLREANMAPPRPPEWGGSTLEPVRPYSQGVPLLSWQQLVTGDLVSGDSTIACPVPHGPRAFAVRARGDAMFSPSAPQSVADGHLVFADPDRQPEHRQLVVVRHNGTPLLRQYLLEPEGAMLAALNPAWPDRFIRVGPETEVLGVVIFVGYAP